jgi:hypothetical protein
MPPPFAALIGVFFVGVPGLDPLYVGFGAAVPFEISGSGRLV